MVLRCESGELDPAVAQWWTDFIEADSGARELLLTQSTNKEGAPRRRRRRGGAGKGRGPAESGSGDQAESGQEPFGQT